MFRLVWQSNINTFSVLILLISYQLSLDLQHRGSRHMYIKIKYKDKENLRSSSEDVKKEESNESQFSDAYKGQLDQERQAEMTTTKRVF
jgi:hypothetical protein